MVAATCDMEASNCEPTSIAASLISLMAPTSFFAPAMIAAEPILAAVYVQMGFHEKTSGRGMISNWCLAGATVLGVLVWAINPYIDILYYGSCVLMMVCVVWCFFDGLYYYNQLMTRPLPQFQNKRGKDLA